jgi:trk system potassium uptake protein TrkA
MKCIIIGLGTYGRVLADEMSALGHEVIAADSDASRVERVKDICDAAFQIDACDELALGVLPLKKVDVVIVAIGSNLGASVRVVALLKKLGVKNIYARANDYVHKSILQAFDIEKILIPEERAARSLVRQMDLGVTTELYRVDVEYCVYKFDVPEKFVGQRANDLQLYENYHLKIIAVKKKERVQNFVGIEYDAFVVANVSEGEDKPLEAGDVLVCYGKESDFRKLCRVLN